MSLFATLNEFLDTPLGKSVLSLLSGTAVGIGAWWLRGKFNAGRVRQLRKEVDALTKQLYGVRVDLTAERQRSTALQHEIELRQPEVVELRQVLALCQKKREFYRIEGGKLHHAHTVLRTERDSLAASEKVLRENLGDAGAQLEALRAELDARQVDLDQRKVELDRTERRAKAAVKLEGNLWAARAHQKVRKFRALSERLCPIISVLNLKGGVGKTTITGQLGIAMARRGHRVLMLDLDLQGSLSQTFLGYDKLQQLAADKRLIHHFLSAAAANPTVKLKEYVQQVATIPDFDGCLDIVAASDDLAYAEFSLTLKWLLNRGDRDNRFLLRRAVQLMDVCNDYDLVLIDCPPLVNMSCINALAATDYLLIPVTLSGHTTDRVVALLKRFLRDERFKKHIHHDLQVLGVVANRTYGDALTAGERGVWNILGTRVKDALGHDVRQFGTVIPNLVRELRDNEDLAGIPKPETRLAQVFAAFAAEIMQGLPNECRLRAKALS